VGIKLAKRTYNLVQLSLHVVSDENVPVIARSQRVARMRAR
jgi:hypothetical protein